MGLSRMNLSNNSEEKCLEFEKWKQFFSFKKTEYHCTFYLSILTKANKGNKMKTIITYNFAVSLMLGSGPPNKFSFIKYIYAFLG